MKPVITVNLEQCFNSNLATVYSLNNVRLMYVPSDLALENEILNCSKWILPRESREGHESKLSLFINAKRYFLRDALKIH